MRRSMAAATSGSWVMTTMVVPSSVQLAEQLEDGRAGRRVQVPGRLVGHDQGGPAGQGPGDGGALLLAARQLVRPVPDAVAQARPARWPPRPVGGARPARPPR